MKFPRLVSFCHVVIWPTSSSMGEISAACPGSLGQVSFRLGPIPELSWTSCPHPEEPLATSQHRDRTNPWLFHTSWFPQTQMELKNTPSRARAPGCSAACPWRQPETLLGWPVTSVPRLNKKLLHHKSDVKFNLLMNIKNTSNNAFIGKYWQRVTISKKWLKYTKSSWVIPLWDFCSMVTLKESLDYPTASPYAYVCCLCPFYNLNHFLSAISLTGSLLKEKLGGGVGIWREKKNTARKHRDKIFFLTKTTRYFKCNR